MSVLGPPEIKGSSVQSSPHRWIKVTPNDSACNPEYLKLNPLNACKGREDARTESGTSTPSRLTKKSGRSVKFEAASQESMRQQRRLANPGSSLQSLLIQSNSITHTMMRRRKLHLVTDMKM